MAKANYVVLPKSERKMVAGARLVGPSHPDELMEVSVHIRRAHDIHGAEGCKHAT